MRTRFLICSIVVLTFSMLMAFAALADCPPGKTAVTIVNAAGRVIVICIADAAIGQIGGEGDVVIPAECPGFTQEDIEGVFVVYPNVICYLLEGATSGSNEPCTLVDCYDTGTGIYFWASEGPSDFKDTGACTFGNISIKDDPNRVTPITIDGEIIIIGDQITIPEDEADACVSILGTFVPE